MSLRTNRSALLFALPGWILFFPGGGGGMRPSAPKTPLARQARSPPSPAFFMNGPDLTRSSLLPLTLKERTRKKWASHHSVPNMKIAARAKLQEKSSKGCGCCDSQRCGRSPVSTTYSCWTCDNRQAVGSCFAYQSQAAGAAAAADLYSCVNSCTRKCEHAPFPCLSYGYAPTCQTKTSGRKPVVHERR